MPKEMTRTKKGKMGRPRKDVDFETIDRLCSIHCTGEEIVDYLNLQDQTISYDTIARRVHEIYGITFAEYIRKKHNATAKPSLRRQQWKLAESGNATMLIWLGKQYLGQRDPESRVKTEISGRDGGPIKTADLSSLSTEELKTLERIAQSAGADEPGGNTE